MRTPEEIHRDAVDRTPFSNGYEWDCWSANWCDKCVHDRSAREGTYKDGSCFLILTGMLGQTPVEWVLKDRLSLGEQYQCTEFILDEELDS